MSIAYRQTVATKMRLGSVRGPVSLSLVPEAQATNFVAYLDANGEPQYATYNGLSVAHNDPGQPTVKDGRLNMRREQVLHIGRIEDLMATRANPPFVQHYDDPDPALAGA